MTLEEQFKQAEADTKLFTKRPDNDTLLRMYSLHKQAMMGDAPEKSTAGMFDFVATAKYNAWRKQAGISTDDAMQQYIALVAEVKQKQ